MVVQTTNPFTITVDLGEVKSFNRLTLIPSADNPGWFLPNFALHAAGENGEFCLVKEFGAQSAPTDQTPVNYDIYGGVTARYLRLEVPNAWWNGMSNDSRVAELELYNVEDLTPPAEEETDNLAFGASVTCDAAHPDFPASYLTDGNYAFEGHTMVVQTAEPFTVTVDLGEEKTFNTLTLVPSADNPGWFFPNFTIHAAGEDGTFSLIESIRVREAPVDQTPISYYLHRDVTARYLQLEISGGWWNGMSNDSRVAELELYYAEPLDKVPLRVMDATVSYDYGLEGGIPTGTKYLTDGNTDPSSGMYFNVSESASQGKLFDDAVTITLLMQKPAMVHEILVYAGRNWPSTFAVSLSADGGRTWGEPVALVADLTWGRAGNCYTLAIEPQKANAVKILFADVVPAETAWGTFGYLSLSEIEVYGKFIDEVLPTPAQKPDVKYSYDKIDMSHYLDGYRADAWPGDPTSYNSWDIRSEWLEITDSLEHTDYTPRYSKAFLIDGKYQLGGDAWASYRVGPDGSAVGLDTNEVNQTIRLKLPNKYLVGQIALCAKLPNSNNFPKDFTISVSTDGRNWKVVREVTDFHLTNGRSQQLFAFDPAEASYIKLDIATVGGTIDDVNVGWGASLTELEVYRVTSTSVNTGEANTWPIVGVVAVATVSVFIGCVCFGKRRRTSVQG